MVLQAAEVRPEFVRLYRRIQLSTKDFSIPPCSRIGDLIWIDDHMDFQISVLVFGFLDSLYYTPVFS